MKTKEEWFAEANISDELAAKRIQDSNGAVGYQGGGAPTSHPLRDGTRGPLTPGGFSVGEAPLGTDENGEVNLPPDIRPMRGLNMREAPEPDRREFVVDGLIPTGACTSLYGDGGVAKSLIALDLCCALAAGREKWMGRDITGCAALYLDFELTDDEQIRRTKALCRGAGYGEAPSEITYLSALGYSQREAFWNAYRLAVEDGIGLLVVDSFGLALNGEAESASDIIGFYRRYLSPFVERDIAVLIIDHQSKGGDSYQRKTSFGSVYKRNLVRSEIQLEALDQDEEAGTLDLVFRHTKHNFGARLRPLGGKVSFKDDEIRVSALELNPSRLLLEEGLRAPERVLLALEDIQGPTTAKEIADHADMNLKTVKNAVSNLKRRSKVRITGDTRGGLDVIELIEDGPVRYLPVQRERRTGPAEHSPEDSPEGGEF